MKGVADRVALKGQTNTTPPFNAQYMVTVIPLKIRPSNFENKYLFEWNLSNISPIIRLQN